jgi:hypothetical protein
MRKSKFGSNSNWLYMRTERFEEIAVIVESGKDYPISSN